MQCIPDIAYAPAHGQRGLGDLHLPDQPDGAPAALVIHGGGWNAMDKHGLAGVAQLMAEAGYAAYNINYRLLDTAPWPACGDDCLAAARFMLDAGHDAFESIDRRQLLVIGASAGGHLALMTGLRLEPARVRGIVSISGPTDLTRRRRGNDAFWCESTFRQKFLGEQAADDEAAMAHASPVGLASADAPPLLCVHSRNDQLVRPEQSQWMVDAWRAAGASAELFLFDGPGDSHGIWIAGTDPHRLLPEPAEAIHAFIAARRDDAAPATGA